MARMLALMLISALLLAGCAFGRADETPVPITAPPPATDQPAAAALADDAEAPGDVVALNPESVSAPDPFAQLPALLTYDAEIRSLWARFHELTADAFRAGRPFATDESAALWDIRDAWLEAAVNQLGSTVRDLELGASAAPPEVADYAEALHDLSLWLWRSWQEGLGAGGLTDATGSAWVHAYQRLVAARDQVLLEALPVGHPSHDYIAAFTEYMLVAWPANDEPVPADQDHWAALVSWLESLRSTWSALPPPSGWAEFHDQWAVHLANAVEAGRLAEPERLQNATQAQILAVLLSNGGVLATRETLYAEWLTMVGLEVAAAHPLPGADEEPATS